MKKNLYIARVASVDEIFYYLTIIGADFQSSLGKLIFKLILYSMPLNTRHQSKHSEEKSLEVPAQEDSELAKTANELLGTVDDPQLANTEVS